MSRPEPDPVVAAALRAVEVPDHAPGFWERLDEALDRAATPRARARRRGRRLAAAAALTALVVLAAAFAARRPASGPVVGTEGTSPRPPTSAPSPVPPDVERAAAAAATGFIDALARLDTDGARALLGPRSVAFGRRQGSLDGLLPPGSSTLAGARSLHPTGSTPIAGTAAAAMDTAAWAAWAEAEGRRVEVIVSSPTPAGLRTLPGQELPGPEATFVVLTGSRVVDGRRDERPSVLPVVADGGRWLAEPWALRSPEDAAAVEPASDDGTVAARPDGFVVVGTGDPRGPQVTWTWRVPALPGRHQLTVDGQLFSAGRESQSFGAGGAALVGRHLVVVLFVSGDGAARLGTAVWVSGES
jgi:hypothetical protein